MKNSNCSSTNAFSVGVQRTKLITFGCGLHENDVQESCSLEKQRVHTTQLFSSQVHWFQQQVCCKWGKDQWYTSWFQQHHQMSENHCMFCGRYCFGGQACTFCYSEGWKTCSPVRDRKCEWSNPFSFRWITKSVAFGCKCWIERDLWWSQQTEHLDTYESSGTFHDHANTLKTTRSVSTFWT